MHELEGFFCKTVVSGIKSKFDGTGKKRHGPNQQAGPTDGQKNKRRALGCAHTGPGPVSGTCRRIWRPTAMANQRRALGLAGLGRGEAAVGRPMKARQRLVHEMVGIL